MSQELKLPYVNLVMISGRLVKDPFPLAAGDREGSSLVVACNRYIKGKPTISTFVDAVAWGDVAKAINSHCKKGDAVLISGALAQYEAKGNGGKKTQVSIASIQFLTRPEQDVEAAE